MDNDEDDEPLDGITFTKIIVTDIKINLLQDAV